MMQFYYHPSPNPAKVALLLEELGLPYEVRPIDTRKGAQFDPSFLAINPNAKTPALVDGEAVLFDSNAILLYLAEKTGRFLPPAGDAARGTLLSWLMFVASGIGPYSGQSVHFRHHAPSPDDYALNRYRREAERHWGLVDARLGHHRFMVADEYGIVDMAVWGWAQRLGRVLGEEAWTHLPHLRRLYDEIESRPAAARANALASRFDFKHEIDEEARGYLFPQNRHLPAGAAS